jgi:hypothetical protein
MKKLIPLLLLAIFVWMMSQGPVEVLAQGYSYSSSNPQQEIAKAQQDYQKWVQENAPKMQQDVQRAQIEGKPFEAQKIAIKWQYDSAMKSIEMQEKIWQCQNPRR